MAFLTFTPKKMLVLLFTKYDVIVGMANKPEKIDDDIFELKIATAVTEDGKMSPLGNEETKRFNWAYWKPFSFGQAKGIPTTGLGVYIHPDNPILRLMNQSLLTQNKILIDKIRDLERELGLSEREKRRVTTKGRRHRLSEAKVIGEETQRARGWLPSVYIPGISEKFKKEEERELE